MAAPFDWKRTRAGEKHIGLGNTPKDDSISTFRNISQASPGRDLRLPPALRPLHFDQFPSDPKDPTRRGPGMVAVQRRLVGSDGKSKGKHSVEAATQVPLLDPMVSIDRTAQQDAWHGNKAYRGEIQGTPRAPGRTLHAPISGTLPISESQQYLMGDALPEDVHDYDVELDNNGNARVLDEEGQQADLVTYRPFFYDSQGNIVYRDDTAVMEPEDHKQLDIHPLFGRRTKTQTEHMGRPLPHQITGTGDFVMFPAGPVGEMAEPIPISQGTRFAGNTGVVTPHGMYFPKNIDWTNVQRAEGLAELGAVLIKAISSDPDDWEKMYDWDTNLGGGFPSAKESGTKRTGGGGFQEIADWVANNPDQMRAAIGGRGAKARKVDWPLKGRQIAEWDDIMEDEGVPEIDRLDEALKTHYGYGRAKAMPGLSILDTSPLACPYSTPEDPLSACGNCYACKNHFLFNNAQNNMWGRTRMLHNDPMRLASAYKESLSPMSAQYKMTRRSRPPVRGKVSGDLTPGELSMLADIMEQQPDHDKQDLWLASRQYPTIKNFLDARGWDDWNPDNIRLRLSMPGKKTHNDLPGGDLISELLTHPNVVPSSYDTVAPGYVICPKTEKGNTPQCNSNIDPLTGQKGCRACWSDKPVVYGHHDGKPSRVFSPEEKAMGQMESSHNTPTNTRRLPMFRE